MTKILIKMNNVTVDRLEEVYRLCTCWPHKMYENFPKYSSLKKSHKQIVRAQEVGTSLKEYYSEQEGLLLKTPTLRCCNEAFVAAFSIPLDVGFGSSGSLDMLRSLERCKNDEIFKIPVIQGYLAYKWSQSVYYLLIEAGIYLVFLILFNVFALNESARGSILLKALMTIFWIVFALREVVQAIGRGKDYFRDVWNYIDIALVVTYLGSFAANEASSSEDWFIVFCLIMMWVKVIAYFRLWDSTRYLIRSIIEIVKDMVPFLLVFLVMLLCFSCTLAASFSGQYFNNTSFLQRMH